MSSAGHNRPVLLSGFLLAVAAALAACLVGELSPIRLLNLKTYDFLTTLRPAQDAPPVTIVAIDDRTRAEIPEPMIFWHGYYVKLLKALQESGARAIGLDMVFAVPTEKWTPGADEQLAAAYMQVVHAGTPVVLAYDRSHQLPDIALYRLASTNNAFGSINLTSDEDDFIRQAVLTASDGEEAEAFALRLAALASASQASGRGLPGGNRVGGQMSGKVRINFGRPGSIPTVSFLDVIRAFDSGKLESVRRQVSGRIVIVGADDASDRHATPALSLRNKQRMRGCEIHAWTLATILDGPPIRDVPRAWQVLVVLIAAVLSAGFCLWLTWWRGMIACTVLIPGVLALSVGLLSGRFWLPVWQSVTAIVFAQSGTFVYRYRTELRERWRIRRLFERYVSPEVLKEIQQHGEIPLSGRRERITVLIADVRDYTAWAEQHEPEEVVLQLNEYFAAMCEAIMRNRGFVDKFMGDGILAVFGAPLADPEHAWHAVDAGLQMLAALHGLNRRWAGQCLSEFVIGIGIHTGEAVVGTIGSGQKLEYTALGDTVNATARIESATRGYDPPIVISEATRKGIVGRPVTVNDIGQTVLKGKAETLRLFQVLGDAPEAASCGAGGTSQ